MEPATPHDLLLDALGTDSEDLGPWSVYSDLLQTSGDPRGELISMMLERERAPSQQLLEMQRRFLAKRGASLVPEAHAPNVAALTWRRGFVAELRIDRPEQLAAAHGEPALRFVDAATLAIDGEHWDDWCDALASRPLPWRRIRIELANPPEPLLLEPLLAGFPTVETLRVACVDEAAALAFGAIRAPELRFVALVNVGEVGTLDTAELPQLRELRLLGQSMTSDALRASRGWSQLEHVVLSFADASEPTDTRPAVRMTQPIERDVDRESNAFVVIGQPIELALVQKLVTRMSGIAQLSVRLAHLRSLPRPVTVLQLYGSADADLLPYGLGVALENVLAPPPPIALIEIDESHGRFLVLGKSPVRGELAPCEEVARRAIDLAIGRDPGPTILEDVLDELAAAPEHVLIGDGYARTLLTVIDPIAAPLIDFDDDYEDEDEDDEDEGAWDDEDDASTVYEEPVLLVEERVADVEAYPEPDIPPPDDDQELFELTEHDALDHPETWFEFRDHWDDRAVDPDDEPGELRWPDPEHLANEAAFDVGRQIAEPACIVHGAALGECRWCDTMYCAECRPALPNAPDDSCAACAAKLDQPLPPAENRPHPTARTVSS